MNYAIFDYGISLIALRKPSVDPENYTHSVSWTEFTSLHLVSTLTRDFERRWTSVDARSLGISLLEFGPRAIKELGPGVVAKQLTVPEKAVTRIAKRDATFFALIGRPGSGKSTIASSLLRTFHTNLPTLKISHVTDLSFLSAAFEAPVTNRFVKTADEGWFITDQSLYDDALLSMSADAKEASKTSDFVILEFARHRYRDSVQLLEHNGIELSLIVYVDVPFDIAYQRNVIRSKAGSGHYVSEREMRETYLMDDLEEMRKDLRTVIIPNDELNKVMTDQATELVFDELRRLASSSRFLPDNSGM